jgi:hypothetical protein
MLKRRSKRRFANRRGGHAIPSAPEVLPRLERSYSSDQVDGDAAHGQKASGPFIWPLPYLLPLSFFFFLLNHLPSYSLITEPCAEVIES